ncbi:hypothetical protein RHMOL_Rhmol07G0187700 [Rhododendron molle]|uniref:Uncharacterized protein n=1 Tax=Rhododendron molle TaxID=49168 RepID=A0ACC0N396_RHOML|nr:hypothetical protein RHMOL_Rhmol07G0187700 [Rhododendron molle]
MQRTIPRDTRRRRSSYLLRFGRASDVLNRYMMMKALAAMLATMEGRNSAMVVATMKADEGRREQRREWRSRGRRDDEEGPTSKKPDEDEEH